MGGALFCESESFRYSFCCVFGLFYTQKTVCLNGQIKKKQLKPPEYAECSNHGGHNCFWWSITITPNVALMSKLPVVDALEGHPFNRHLSETNAH